MTHSNERQSHIKTSCCNSSSRQTHWAAWVLLLTLASVLPCKPARAADFVNPTPEELAMTSVPGYPGVPAVILYREEITRDGLRSVQHYERIKILTEEGKSYANVQLSYFTTQGHDYFGNNDELTVEDISGRTIEPDGKVIPFTGKPYFKVIDKANGYKFQQKVFTLPEVQVGSIIEFRYVTRYDMVFHSPNWMIQDELFLKDGHFAWYPTDQNLINSEGKPISYISWFPLLPQGAKIEHREMPGGVAVGGSTQVYELHVKDVPPKLKEEFMPPIQNFSYRVNFSFTPYRTGQEFWKEEGKTWSKNVNKFADPNSGVKDATEKLIAGASSPEEKLRKIYAAVMALENTGFTRNRDSREDKASGEGEIHTAGDVLSHERGNPFQLTELFISMARAAGFKAYAMLVPDREERIFIPDWLSFSQFDDMIAIVSVDGKEQFFDPGSRYASFGQLAWQHTIVKGLRQVEGGTQLDQTPGDDYKTNRTTRVANLTMDKEGQVAGKVDLTFYGAPALRWRQVALRGDDESLRHGLRTSLEHMVPKSLEVEVSKIQNLTDYEAPLVVTYQVKGSMGSATGKRILLPNDLFLADKPATFPQEKRELAVYFPYPQAIQDAVRVNLPPEFTVEAAPPSSKLKFANAAAYSIDIAPAANNVTTRRDFINAAVVVPVPQYGDLRSFYSQLESKDQESIVLKLAPPTTASSTN